MGRASIKTNLGDSHIGESCKNPTPMDIRLERRWKRRDAMAVSFKDKFSASATKRTAKISETKAVLSDKNDHMLEDEVDKDYEKFLDENVLHIDIDNDETEEGTNTEVEKNCKEFLEDEYASDDDSASDNSVSDIEAITSYRSDTDETDEDYRQFLDTYDGDTDETNEDYRAFLDTYDGDADETDEEYRAFLDTYDGDTDETDEDYRAFLDTYDGDTDETDEDYRAFLDTYDGDTGETNEVFRAFSEAYDTEIDETDEDYQVFLNSDKIVDFNLVGDGSSSSDSDLILIEPNPICENTPFVYSKTYDSSWFDKEMNIGDGKHLSSDDHSEFRRRLMEHLQKPYDQEEYILALQAVNQQRKKERHIETRKRVIKSYQTYGLNKSYLELYPDLAKAIAEFSEPHRALFLLRGFIFWLKNVCHEGKFQPWLDESCLEALRKM